FLLAEEHHRAGGSRGRIGGRRRGRRVVVRQGHGRRKRQRGNRQTSQPIHYSPPRDVSSLCTAGGGVDDATARSLDSNAVLATPSVSAGTVTTPPFTNIAKGPMSMPAPSASAEWSLPTAPSANERSRISTSPTRT